LEKFNFKLENILKVKKIKEDLEKAQLVVLQNRYQEEEKHLDNLQDSYAAYQDQLRTKQGQLMTVSELSMYKYYFKKQTQEINKQEEIVANLEQEVSKQREELVSKVKERKIMENLKQKKLSEFHKMILGKEQVFLDEIATNNFVRPKG